MAKMYQPNWDKHDVRTIKGSEAFVDDREREMATNPQAKEWEESRRRTLQAQKHDYSIKEKLEDTEELRETLKDMKKGGTFDKNLIPAKGFILVKVDLFKKETDTGIKLPDEMMPMSNTGVVVANGMTDVPVGAHILFKKGAGLDVVIKDEALKLIRCVEDINLTDFLGMFEE